MYLLLVVFLLNGVESGNILAFLTLPTSRHEPILKELSLEGHGVTVITPNPLKDESLTNLTEIDLHEISSSMWNKYNISTEESTLTDLEILAETVIDLTNSQLNHPQVKEFIKNKGEIKFDVCLIDYLNGLLCPLIDIFDCKMITISSLPLQMLEHMVLGNINHPILYPDINLPFSQDLNVFERFQSVYHYYFARRNYGRIELLVKKHFGKSLSVTEMLQKMSLVLTNVNPVLYPPRPNIPTVIEIKGLNIEHEKPLPNDLQKFMDNSQQGVIYINLASNAKNVVLPKEKIRIILNTINELPYIFLWKYQFKITDKTPDNLLINNSFPQISILSHRNLKLFINQGRFKDLDEAMHTETPVVVIPFYRDQVRNAKKVEAIGMGKYLLYTKMNKVDFKSVITEALSSKFVQRAETLFDLITDEPSSANSEIIWWIEYFLRHKQVDYLKNRLLINNQPFYVYYMFDVAAFMLIVFSTFGLFVAGFIRFATKCLVFLNPIEVVKKKTT